MKMEYHSTIICSKCLQVRNFEESVSYVAYTVNKNFDGSKRKVLKSPIFICEECNKSIKENGSF